MRSVRRVDEILAQLEEVHLRLLRVCQEYPKDGHGTFCGGWIRRRCEQDGIPFHQSSLRAFVNLGLLELDDLSRGGNRRYYRIKDTALVQEVLALQPA